MDNTRILIVDDIFFNRLVLSTTCDEVGVQSKQANNGQEAVDMMEEQDFDLVLMDIEMPVMNGMETIQHIRDNMQDVYDNVPIIAMTAHESKSKHEKFLQAGFTEVFVKPYSVDRLKELIEKYRNKTDEIV